jgi:hypothetical protein
VIKVGIKWSNGNTPGDRPTATLGDLWRARGEIRSSIGNQPLRHPLR